MFSGKDRNVAKDEEIALVGEECMTFRTCVYLLIKKNQDTTYK